MVELSERWRPVLNALIDASIAWQAPSQIAAALGRSVEETTDLLCELDVAGWIVVWDDPEGPVITLSALAAERLELHIVEVGLREIPRWARAGVPDPTPPRPAHVSWSQLGAKLDYVLETSPAPETVAELSENTEAFARAAGPDTYESTRSNDLPRPTQLVGVGLSPWPGPEQVTAPSENCPACGSRKLRPQMYCLYCDRWGLDGLIPKVQALPAAAKPPRTQHAAVVSLADQKALEKTMKERERARRKSKRRRHHHHRIEAESKEKSARALSPQPGQTAPRGPGMSPSPCFAQPPASARNSANAAR